MLIRSLRICITSSVLAFTASTTQAVDESAATVDYFTDTGYGSPVATIQHPAGEYHEGVTYVAYQGLDEDPYVAAYDHDTEDWVGPYQAGISDLGKNQQTKIDNHGRPALIIDDAGYIHLVFGGHGGMTTHGKNPLGNTHLGTMKHVVTERPLDISSWEQLDNVPPFGTYNQFVKMDNADLYLFYRHGAHRSNWVYQKSNDNGRTFAPPVSVLKTRPRNDMPAHDAWYAWFKKGHGDEIIAGYNYHLCKEEDVHDGERHNGYYMVMDTNDHVWRNVEGETLETPIIKEYADKKTLVVDTGDLWSVCGTAALDSLGHPHVTFTTGEHMGLRHGGPKEINHYQWTGKEWTDEGHAGLPVAVGDMDIISPKHVRLLLAHKDDKKTGEVAWWSRQNPGDSFTKEAVLLSLKKNGVVISSMIHNAHPDARVVVASKKGNTDYSKVYLVGDNGPVKRLQVEAETLSAADKAKIKRTKAQARGK